LLGAAAGGSHPLACFFDRPGFRGEGGGEPESIGRPRPARCWPNAPLPGQPRWRFLERVDTHPSFQETRAVSWKFHLSQRTQESAELLTASLVMAIRRASTFCGRRRLSRPRPLQPAQALSIKLCHTNSTMPSRHRWHAGSQKRGAKSQFRAKRFLTPGPPTLEPLPPAGFTRASWFLGTNRNVPAARVSHAPAAARRFPPRSATRAGGSCVFRFPQPRGFCR